MSSLVAALKERKATGLLTTNKKEEFQTKKNRLVHPIDPSLMGHDTILIMLKLLWN
jgi:hypothetical protein